MVFWMVRTRAIVTFLGYFRFFWKVNYLTNKCLLFYSCNTPLNGVGDFPNFVAKLESINRYLDPII